MNIRITNTTRHQKRLSTSNTKVKARTTLPWSWEAIRAAWRLLGWNPRIRGDDAPRLLFARHDDVLFFMNNIGYIFIVRRLGKQSNPILSRSDSISNLELNLKIHGPCGPNAHAGADLQAFLIFCFKPILLSAHKLTLLTYGDNSQSIWPVDWQGNRINVKFEGKCSPSTEKSTKHASQFDLKLTREKTKSNSRV